MVAPFCLQIPYVFFTLACTVNKAGDNRYYSLTTDMNRCYFDEPCFYENVFDFFKSYQLNTIDMEL